MIVVKRLAGYTRSRKWIYAYATKDQSYIETKTSKFNDSDHFDAVCAFECLILRAFRQHGESSPEFDDFSNMEAFHRNRLSGVFIEQEKKSLGLITSLHTRSYGENRLHHSLRV
jgi:hypothetical protein